MFYDHPFTAHLTNSISLLLLVLIIAAAGNSDNSVEEYPASYPVVMSVGSVTSTRVRSSFSQYNESVIMKLAPKGSFVPLAMILFFFS